MTANLRIVPLNHHDAATLSTSAAAATGFPVTNTQNATRSLVWKSTSNAAQSISGTFAASRSATFWGMFLHTAAGGSVRLQLYSDAAWTTQVYDSTALAASNITSTDVYDWGNFSNDQFRSAGPYWLWFAEVTFLSYKISFSGTPTVGYWQASRIWLGKGFEVSVNPDYGATLGFSTLTDRNRSRGGSLRTNVGPMWRVMQLDLNFLAEAERGAMLDIFQYLGTGRDFVLSLFPADGTRLERDNMVNAKFSALDVLGRQVNRLTNKLQVEEV